MSELFKNLGVEVEIDDSKFNIIRETLTRIGIASHQKRTLTQTAHIFHKQGKYVIAHFKEMLKFDGKEVDISEDDIKRRDTIIKLLVDWGLVSTTNNLNTETDTPTFKVITAKDKPKWTLIAKYTFGG